MTVYAISGLGADKSVFKYLNLNFNLVHINWIDNYKNESIENYSLRLAKTINTKEKFAIIGLSFGGLIAIEISKILKPTHTILISSAKVRNEIPLIYRLLGTTKLFNLVPSLLLKCSNIIVQYMFGTKKNKLLKEVIKNSNAKFSKWAAIELMNWKNEKEITCIKINGSKDKIIPFTKKDDYIIEGGQHLMIIDKANEISAILNRIVMMKKSNF